MVVGMPTIENTHKKEPVLGREEFNAVSDNGFPRYGDFHLYFFKTPLIYKLQETTYYQEFEEKYPNLAASLSDAMKGFSKAPDSVEFLKGLNNDLYTAYFLMRGFGASDEDLFLKKL